MKGVSITSGDEPLEIKTFFAVLYGLPGVGKTSLSFTAPGNVLHLNFDRGLHRAIQKNRPTSMDVTDFSGFYEALRGAEFEAYVRDNGIKTVVIDTAGKLLDDFIAPFLIKTDMKNANHAGGLTLQGYGALKTVFSAIKSRLQTFGVNTVCVCHAKEVGDGQNLRFDLAVSGGSSDVLHSTADLIGFVSVRPDGQRQVNFNATAQTIGKAIGRLDPVAIPDADSEGYDTCLADIFAKVAANVRGGSERQIAFREKLDGWNLKIADCESAADFNALAADLKKIPESEAVLKNAVRARFKTAIDFLGYTIDPASKAVIAPEVAAK